MIQYIIVHCKHVGCYDHGYYEEEKVGKRMKPIVTINPPKIFLFDNKAQAKEFFDEYINDVFDLYDILIDSNFNYDLRYRNRVIRNKNILTKIKNIELIIFFIELFKYPKLQILFNSFI